MSSIILESRSGAGSVRREDDDDLEQERRRYEGSGKHRNTLLVRGSKRFAFPSATSPAPRLAATPPPGLRDWRAFVPTARLLARPRVLWTGIRLPVCSTVTWIAVFLDRGICDGSDDWRECQQVALLGSRSFCRASER